MALEAVVFSQDSLYSSSSLSYDFGNDFGSFYTSNPISEIINPKQWDPRELEQNQFINSSTYSSPEGNNGYCNMDQQQYEFSPPPEAAAGGSATAGGGGGKRKRRRRSSKNKEEKEQQRMTHIAVERNRRKQMNDYLGVIRSLMPPSYSQRGDQASIVGGAINYVKELEQLLQSLQAHKQESDSETTADGHDHHEEAIFGDFFNFPQYSSWSQSGNSSCSSEIQVTMVEGHANVRILAKKKQKQLLRLVAAFQGLRLSVLHLNVTTLHPFVLYSFNLKVEEGCELNSVDDVAAAANHIVAQIQEEAAALLQ